MQDTKKTYWNLLPLRQQKGFTLLEVLVAVSVLGIAIVAVLQLFSSNLRSIATSEDYAYAAIKAESKLRDIITEKELREKTMDEITDDGYRLSVSISEDKKDRTDKLNIRLMKVNVTVQWTKDRKDKSMTVGTLKVVPKE